MAEGRQLLNILCINFFPIGSTTNNKFDRHLKRLAFENCMMIGMTINLPKNSHRFFTDEGMLTESLKQTLHFNLNN